MPIIKCKMCGGDLNLTEGSTVCECEYCGTKQTVPNADNEKKLTLFNRAGRLLRACEFDKAAGVFETIVADFPQEAEAYWGLVLCKYGIEYVDDPATGKKIPTCHRSSFDSVMKDPNFEQACENTDAVARRVYRDEARAIEELRKNIIEVSGKEEPYDVFISYKETDANGERTPDSELAQKIYRELSREGYRVFFSRISLESHLGTEYEPYIFAALNSAKVMLVVGTDYENFDAVWVKNEWSRFLKLIAKGEKKTLIPVYKDMDAYDMPEEFSKLTALDMGRIAAMEDLIHGVEKLAGKKKAEPVQAQPVQQVVQQTVVQGGGPNVLALLKRGQQALEDGDWAKAKGFYDQVLSMDAENADAFLGLALAGQQVRDLRSYIDALFPRRVNIETDTLECDQAHIGRSITKSVVPGYCEGSELKKLYDFAVAYPVKLREETAATQQIKSRFNGDRNLSRAFRYAQGETKQKLETLKNELFDTLDKRVRAAEASDKKALEEARAEFDAKLEAADQKAEELSHAAQEKREADYQQACRMQEKAESEKDYEEASKAFLRTGTYKDAAERAKACQRKHDALRASAEEARKKAEATAAKKRNKTIVIITAISVVCIAFILVLTTVILPKQKYKALGEKYGQDYVDAFYALDVGDSFNFGSYEQDNNTVDGQEDIEWLVLDKSGDRILVISRYALDCRMYHSVKTDTTWETCSLREWLNNGFLQTAFTAGEQAMIPSVTVKAEGNKGYSIDGGSNTTDQVFLLSKNEAVKYFINDAKKNSGLENGLKCTATAYCKAVGSFGGLCDWWLRSPGSGSYKAAIVEGSGHIWDYGSEVNRFSVGVRPAMWIELGD